MKHRESISRKLDGVESNLSKLNLALNQGDRNLAKDIIADIREQTQQIKDYIENEPIVGNELNKSA